LIEANEESKKLDRFTNYVEQLARQAVRRGHTLVAVGGGVTQDIACFLATTLYRGVSWVFYPTTLLAQADSCIGSKSSINVGEFKNILGTFTPPTQIFIDSEVLRTLQLTEVHSGVGEMLKIHLNAGPQKFSEIEAVFDNLFEDSSIMLEFIYKSLLIKQTFIEADEFDRNIRNVLNYGHSFGHAIESATHFAVPHGIAVTMGMDLANFIAIKTGLTSESSSEYWKRVHRVLAKNFRGYETVEVPFSPFLEALGRDKKNTSSELGLILPGPDCVPMRVHRSNDLPFQSLCREYFETVRKT
ncbi:MAG: iron-containing alcohol dehydrogenase, partial [Proteobacteria bacterium]